MPGLSPSCPHSATCARCHVHVLSGPSSEAFILTSKDTAVPGRGGGGTDRIGKGRAPGGQP